MDVTIQEIEIAQQRVQPHGRHDICHHPVVRVVPTLSNHRLCGKIDDVSETLTLEQCTKSVEVAIDIDALKPHATRSLLPFIGQQRVVRLVRARGRKGIMALLSQVIDESSSRKRVRPQNQKFRIGHRSGPSQVVPVGIKMLHDHVPENQLNVFGNLRVIDGKVDGNVAH